MPRSSLVSISSVDKSDFRSKTFARVGASCALSAVTSRLRVSYASRSSVFWSKKFWNISTAQSSAKQGSPINNAGSRNVEDQKCLKISVHSYPAGLLVFGSGFGN